MEPLSEESIQEMFDLSGQVAMVTGGAGFLGTEFCKTLAQAGAALVVADVDGEKGYDLADSLSQGGYQALGVETDVTKADSVHGAVDSALREFGRLDILVNSAALDPKVRKLEAGNQETSELSSDSSLPANKATDPLSFAFEDYPLPLWQQALDVNLTGMFLACQAAVKPMLDQEHGVIVNLASIYGMAAPDQQLYQREGQPPRYKPAYYTVTKAGVLGLTKYLAAYYGERGIRVNALTSGGVYHDHEEEFVQAYAARTVLGRMAEKDELNGALLYLVSQASNYMTGANLVVDGGWTAW